MEEGGTQGLEEYQNTSLPGIDTKDALCCLPQAPTTTRVSSTVK